MTNMRPVGLACLGLASALVIAGCNRSVSALDPRVPPEPLVSAPLDPVESGTLDPTGSGQPPAVQQQEQELASVEPPPGPVQPLTPPVPAGSDPISRESMAGTWTVASDNPECRIILAFTKWSGGYRAATRRCNTPELSAVTAWDVKGNQVVLVDGTGNTVASLYSAGPERYDGQTTGGKAIRFTR